MLAGRLCCGRDSESYRRAHKPEGELAVTCRPHLDDIERHRELTVPLKIGEGLYCLGIPERPTGGFFKIN